MTEQIKELTKWWLNYKPVDNNILEELNGLQPVELTHTDEENWDNLVEELKSLIPFSKSLEGFGLQVAPSGTFLIDNLFKKYVDDNTLVVTSYSEHDAVRENIKRYNLADKCVYINTDGFWENIVYKINQKIKSNHTSAFVYIIGTNITTGHTTPQVYYSTIKKYFEKRNIKVTMVIDDVHGLYVVPRDYSMFDYVLNTSHAVVRNFDMGMLWTKNTEMFGFKQSDRLREYLRYLKPLLERKDKLSCWRDVMKAEFEEYITSWPNYFELMRDSAPHIFTIKVMCQPKVIFREEDPKRLIENEVMLDCPDYNNKNYFFVRLRGAQFMTLPFLLEESIGIAKAILAKVVYVNNFRGGDE